MHLIIDGLIVLLIAFIAFLSAKKGFVCTVIEVVGFVAVIIFINFATPPISNFIYDKAIEPTVIKTIEETITFDNLDNGAINDVIDINSIENAVEASLDKLPKIIAENNSFKFSSQEIVNEINKLNINNKTEIAEIISDKIIKPTIINILSLVIQIILLIVLFIIVKIVAKLINKLFSFSVIGKLNKFLGGVIGIAKGTIIATLSCLVINLILSLTDNNLILFTKEAIDSTYLYKTLINFSSFI